LIDSVVIE